MHKKAEWLQRTFPFIDVKKNLICMQKKQMLGGNIDVLIDDHLGNIIGGRYFSILLSYPWNDDISVLIHPYRCDNWDEIDKALEKVHYAVSCRYDE